VRSDDDDVPGWDVETDLAGAEPSTDSTAGNRAILVCRTATGASVVEVGDAQEAVVGRGPDVALRVDDAKASRRHFAVRVRGGGLEVVDLGSRNGTLVNGRLLRGTELAVAGGCVIRVGDAEIVVASSSVASRRGDADSRADPEWVVADETMERVVSLARKVAPTSATVLLLGETGSGKDVLARRIHAMSRRRGARFVRVNCGALPDTLFESELFGHERGAFTGADRRKIGLVESAVGGTLFIDEVGELSPSAQVKLLHVLENRTITRIGSAAEIPVDIRVICATHRDLEAEATRGAFRADLYYRIRTFVLNLPPLQGRPVAILALAHAFAAAFARAAGETPPTLSGPLADALTSYRWPGNVRELRNAMERALVVADGATLLPEHLPPEIVQPSTPARAAGVQGELARLERQRVEEALHASGGNQTRAAEMLGMSRRTLVYKLARWRRES
jgi:DNA-binding NtrC family response regulator